MSRTHVDIISGARRLSLSTRTLRWCLRSRTRPSTTTSPSSSTPLATPPTGVHSPHSETQYLTTTVLKMNKYLYGQFSFLFDRCFLNPSKPIDSFLCDITLGSSQKNQTTMLILIHITPQTIQCQVILSIFAEISP